MSSFSDFLSTLPEGMKSRIQTALDACADIPDEKSLREIVAGRNIEQITSLLQKAPLSLSVFDASALAVLLVAPTGNYISISYLITVLCCVSQCCYLFQLAWKTHQQCVIIGV
jgi:hypothetical protein